MSSLAKSLSIIANIHKLKGILRYFSLFNNILFETANDEIEKTGNRRTPKV